MSGPKLDFEIRKSHGERILTPAETNGQPQAEALGAAFRRSRAGEQASPSKQAPAEQTTLASDQPKIAEPTTNGPTFKELMLKDGFGAEDMKQHPGIAILRGAGGGGLAGTAAVMAILQPIPYAAARLVAGPKSAENFSGKLAIVPSAAIGGTIGAVIGGIVAAPYVAYKNNVTKKQQQSLSAEDKQLSALLAKKGLLPAMVDAHNSKKSNK